MEGNSGTENVSCPVCQKNFKQSTINRHVNECLNSTNEDTKKDVTASFRRKRKSNLESAWGSLQKPSSKMTKTSPVTSPTNHRRIKRQKLSTPPSKKNKNPAIKCEPADEIDVYTSSETETETETESTDKIWKSLSIDLVACDGRTTPKDTNSSNVDQETIHTNGDQETTHPNSDKEMQNSEDKRQELRHTEERTKSPTNGFIDIGKQQVEGYQDAYKDYVQEASQKENPNQETQSFVKKDVDCKTMFKLELMGKGWRSRSNSPTESGQVKSPTDQIENTEAKYAKVVEIRAKLDSKSKPLSEQMRPLTLNDYIGQDEVMGQSTLLRSLLEKDQIPSLILWGPPGCGKTTLAKIISQKCKSAGSLKFTTLSAAVAGISDVKEVIKIAKNDQRMFKKKTILFLDEIHRFNKTQQDSLLPHVEDGTIILIGATTENPSFQVNSALLSRCRVIVLKKLDTNDLEDILRRAVTNLGVIEVEDRDKVDKKAYKDRVYIEAQAIKTLASLCDGDARAALNCLHMTLQSCVCINPNNIPIATKSHASKLMIVTLENVKEGLQRSHVLYDRAGEEHYNIISAMHKSIRGSDDSAALYWLARMLEGGETPLYIARRLVRIAGEDIGLADPLALNQAVSAYQACHFMGMPECDVILAQCVVYLSRAPKSAEILKAYGAAKNLVKYHEGPLPVVPLHLRNASTKLSKSLGYGKGYKYNPDHPDGVEQEYFPKELKGTDFFT